MKKSEFVKLLKEGVRSSLNKVNEKYVENSKDVINNYTHYKSGDNYYPNSEWARWFLSQDRKTKERIAYNLKTNEDFKNALLSNWYDYYKTTTNSNTSYEKFLNTPIIVYRGETDRDIKYGTAKGFDSYTTQIDLAKHFAKKGANNKIIELKIKPKDTYGMIDTVGNEVEVLIPTSFSEEFLKDKLNDYFNWNDWIYNKLTDVEINKLSDLEDNKEYELAIELLSKYIKKYKI